ncbi:u3 small nucleolar RNA-associated protein 14 homolog A [Caerostris extrusa]|uniref:U3 small nucleolar RNA-associated protein 14 homolog A n=1 Tax=Caerostris extrusa TaxID=172846 RepID=A0AAV4USE3_CAEEX|nr:u3 small nucleolar RNA-associated protein 14 homolog A [Caerostris extrusa]
MIHNIGTDPFQLYGSAFTLPSVYTYARVVYALSEVKRKSSIKRSSILQYYHCKLIFSLFTGELFNMEEDTITLDRNNTDSSENSSKTEKKKKLKKRTINLQRSEASENISEFNLNEVGKETVKLNELIKTSKKLSGAGLVTKQLGKVKKLHSLSVPLSKPQMTKIKRSIGYEKAVEEFDKWDPIVKSNRSAHQTIYPLKKPEIQLQSFEKATEQFVTKHPVEIAVEELLRKSKNVLKKDKTLTEAEEKALKAMSLEEAKLRHNELMKHRALISYKEAKARRQNKIKSKRYHRILKKEKVKKFMEEFENLQQQDAVAALEKLMEADKLRVLERTTLKHRNTGKWSKVQQLRAKYNPEARSNLKEVLVIGRKLREKIPTIQNAINKLTSDLESQLVEETDDSICNKGLIEETNENTSNDETDEVPFKDQSDEPVTNEISNEYAKENSFLEKFSLVKHLQQAENTKRMKCTGSSQKVVVSDLSDMDFSKMSELDSFKPSCVDIGDIMDDIEDNDDVENGNQKA